MKLVLNDTKVFRDCIDTISQIIDDGLFKIKKDGLELRAADRAMVAVVDFKMDSTGFESYIVDEETEMGINLLNLLTILKRAGVNDKLTMDLVKNKLEITLEGDSVRKFSLPLIEMTEEEIPNTSKLNFKSEAEVKADIVGQGIADADIIADSVIFELGSGFRMFAEGNSRKTELNLENGNEALLSLNAAEAVKARYPIEYLKKMIKAARISNNAKIRMGNDYPLSLAFKGDNVSMSFVLAPRIMDE